MGGKGWRGKKKRGRGAPGRGGGGDEDDAADAGDGDDADVAAGEGGGRGGGKAVKRARNDTWREEGAWELANPAYEAYYQRQGVCPPDDWTKLVQALRTGLPVAIRINGMRYGASSLCDRLAEMQEACQSDPAREQYAPQRLSWYPHRLAWQWPGLERRTVKKDIRNLKLKEYLMHRERSGLLSRQEAVSMIPPLFLQPEPHHMVLDMCAAPGSKTAQIMELMHHRHSAEGAPPPTGCVLANELQWKRANMLAHQVQRLGSPCGAVVNMDAQFFPELWAEGQPLRFDRVLCDVPCSGDGTMRKTPYIWKSWTIRDGIALHVRQLGILNRGIDLLKVGGRLVYSTCSLNPVEDEAVVAAAVRRHGGAVVLVPPPDCPGLKAANGLDRWVIQDPNGGTFFESFEDVPKELRDCKCKLTPSMFPPTGEGAEALREELKQNCRRLLPHLMDTGGFFVAVLEKRGELKPSSRARREERSQLAQARRQQEGEAAAGADKPSNAAGAEEEPAVLEAEKGDEAPENPAAAAPSAASSAGSGLPQGLRKITKEYAPVEADGPMWREIADFYGFSPASASSFVLRGGSDQKVFLLSEGVSMLLQSQTKMPTRMVLCGVVALERAPSHDLRACQWRLSQQGVAAVHAVGLTRRLAVSRAFMARLLREKEISLAEVRQAAAGGEVRGLEALKRDPQDANAFCPGTLAVVVLPEVGELRPGAFSPAAVANLSDDMLEVAVGTAAETAALLEELEGQPSVEQLLAAPAAGSAVDTGEEGDEGLGGDSDAEDGPEGDTSGPAADGDA